MPIETDWARHHSRQSSPELQQQEHDGIPTAYFAALLAAWTAYHRSNMRRNPANANQLILYENCCHAAWSDLETEDPAPPMAKVRDIISHAQFGSEHGRQAACDEYRKKAVEYLNEILRKPFTELEEKLHRLPAHRSPLAVEMANLGFQPQIGRRAARRYGVRPGAWTFPSAS
ncbi:hypothetical protein JCM10908_000491 [Rhodotorula pacifica]|uniref:uncharacterized protein n=1 Tax=Rhodotorula pacifica TaxID=1495444 RepID=UPI0031829202